MFGFAITNAGDALRLCPRYAFVGFRFVEKLFHPTIVRNRGWVGVWTMFNAAKYFGMRCWIGSPPPTNYHDT